MRILILGGRGCIGAALAAAFAAAGHSVVRGVRRPVAADEIGIDFARDLDPGVWQPRLAGVDVVINAVGIIVEAAGQCFDAIHHAAPAALFAACVDAGVGRVIQISALGAERGESGYFASKRAADLALMALPVEWQIVRPALIFSAAGRSSRLFLALASLPLLPLPGGGRQLLQPLHIDDLTSAVLRLADPATPPGQCVELAGPAPLRYREMLDAYRRGLGLPPARHVGIPATLVGLAASAAEALPGAIFNRENWRMLQAGNHGDPAPVTRLLGHAPRAVEEFIAPGRAADLRRRAIADWQDPLLRTTLAALWILTALVSVFAYPLADSLALLARVGLDGPPARVALYAAAALDLGFGVATLVRPGRRLWTAQLALVATYTFVIVVGLPEFLVHPFGPVTKNLPILALLTVLHAQETRP